MYINDFVCPHCKKKMDIWISSRHFDLNGAIEIHKNAEITIELTEP